MSLYPSHNNTAPPKSLIKTAYHWLDERLSLESLKYFAEKKKVPVHQHSVWYYMGGIALILLGVQVVTGILLMIYYVPEIKSAHGSILKIMSQVDFGWFVRSMHSWGANLMILALFLHLFSTYFMKAYRAPRELTWLTGLGLMVLAMAFGFTGYLLPWDEVSFFATKIGLDITSKLPLVGHLMVQILQGGAEVSQATLTRFFLIHVILLPLGFLALLGLHLVFIQNQGMSEPEAFKRLPDAQKKYEKFFPDFALKDAMVWLLTLNVLATLVTLFPWGLGPEADPFAPAPQGIKPEWYFLAMFQFLKIIPATVGPFEGEMLGLGFFSLIGLIFAITPFIDCGKHPQISKWAGLFGQIVCIGFVVFTIWGFLA